MYLLLSMGDANVGSCLFLVWGPRLMEEAGQVVAPIVGVLPVH